MIHRIDAWIGLRLFHPPIIWICQHARMTQWAFYRYGWWIYALGALWRDDHRSTVNTVLLVGFALFRTLNAGLSLNSPARESLLLRGMIWCFAVFILMPPITHRDLQAAAMQLVILAAEYATTIRTIPPRKKREKATGQREVWA